MTSTQRDAGPVAFRAGVRYLLQNRAIDPVANLGLSLWTVLGILTATSVLRTALDVMWMPDLFSDWTWYLSMLHDYCIYGVVLAVALPTFMDVLACWGGPTFDPGRLRRFLMVSMVIWTFTYPLVPIVSMIAGSPYFQNTQFTRMIPGFMVTHSFFPMGLFAAIGMLFWKFPGAIRHLYGTSWLRSWASFLGATIFLYVIFYQWVVSYLFEKVAWNPYLQHVPFFGVYSLVMLLFVAAFSRRILLAFPEFDPRWWWRPLWAAVVVFLVAPKVSVLHVVRVLSQS